MNANMPEIEFELERRSKLIMELQVQLDLAREREARLIADTLRAVTDICEFAARGTIEAMSAPGKSETWKILAQQSVEQYQSMLLAISRLTPAQIAAQAEERDRRVVAEAQIDEAEEWFEHVCPQNETEAEWQNSRLAKLRAAVQEKPKGGVSGSES